MNFWPFEPHERHRLKAAIESGKIQLDQIGGIGTNKSDPWWKEAESHLNMASTYLVAEDLHQGWGSVAAAHRALLADPNNSGALEDALTGLRREVEKITGWRAKAITDLIGTPENKLVSAPFTERTRAQAIAAIAYRDEYFQTDYFKILLRHQHLKLLSALLWSTIGIILILSHCDILPPPLDQTKLVAGVILFGAMGAVLSVARSLLAADLSAKIPAQKMGAFVIWMRPGIGAAAALISFVLLQAKVFRLFDLEPDKPTTIFAIAIAAGFSERFIVGAIERMAEAKDKK
jgi:hypothetical protein